jgi:hypothetical protein
MFWPFKKNKSGGEKESCYICGKVLHQGVHKHEKTFCCEKCVEHYEKHGGKKKKNVCEFC